MGEFMGKGFLTPVTLHELWGIAGKAYEAVARGMAQADRLVGGQPRLRVYLLNATLCTVPSSCNQQPNYFPSHSFKPRRAHHDLRATLALLSMAAGSQPQAFTRPHLQNLLRYGFSAACPDALITRHACAALQRLAPNFEAG